MTMTGFHRNEPILLFLGDVVAFLLSLWLTLFIRYWTIPSATLFLTLLTPFAILFFVWAIIFFISGLYEKHTVILKSRLPNIILNAQITNSLIAVLFFYFIPYFGVTPKTNLFIYLVVSFCILLYWRIKGVDILGSKKKENGLLIGSGKEMIELREEVNHNPKYNLKFISSIDLDEVEALDFQEDILKRVYSENIKVVVIDSRNEKSNPILPHLYNLIFSNIKFIDMHRVYEDIFDRVPLSLVKNSWFLENISASPNPVYIFLRRFAEIAISIFLLVITAPFTIFAIIMIKLHDGGVIFSHQNRVGQNNHTIKLLKFRTMDFDDDGKWSGASRENRVTSIGRFLRKSRIDELPQLWNVLRGDISLIGPRPEFLNPVKHYTEQIPYYNIRHIVRPGLSGWAQIYHEQHPHHGIDVDETSNKLSYDLHYIKNQSFLLDIRIALRTIQILLSRKGI